MSSRRAAASILIAFVAVLVPSRAAAQWFGAAYLGTNSTRPAPVAIDVPSENLSLEYHDVQFAARPFESPQYYGIRAGRLFGAARRFGLEVEFIHLKVFGETDRLYRVTGEFGTALLSGPAVEGGQMNAVVQRYAMTHGLNFLVVNFLVRLPVGAGPLSFVGRAGGGPTLPHAETTVLHQARDHYEYAGMGGHAAAGLDLRLRGRLSLVGEYKFTYARPRIDLAGGTGQTTSATHHVVVGLAFGLSR
jgi:hypothetical protein